MAGDYIYAVTRVHTHEGNLLSRADVEAMAATPDAAALAQLLAEKGWGTEADRGDAAAMLARQMDDTWALIAELVDDLSPFDVFRVQNDYHNLKAAIKLAYAAEDMAGAARYMQPFGAIPQETIVKAAAEHDFSALPEGLADAGREAYETLAHTGNGQACDMVIDRAALLAIDAAGKATESELLQSYATLTVDIANIKAAVRANRMQKSAAFIQSAIAPAGTLDTAALASAAAADGPAQIYALLAGTTYADAVGELEKGLAAFELWCENRLMHLIRPQRQNYFSIEPLAAYILARQNEVAMVRILLSAKVNGLGEELVRERMREMYV